MDVVSRAEARRVLPGLQGWVLYLYGDCEMYRLVTARVVAVRRLHPGVEDLVEALKYGLQHAPEPRGFDFTVVEGRGEEEKELLVGLELSQLGKIIYVEC
jgi:hypothetical protein